jgi:hypothetical protein
MFEEKRPISTLLILIREGRQAMEITDVLPRSQVLVKELSEGLNSGLCSLQQIEGRILSFVYELAHTLEREVLSGLQEPTHENSLRVGERTAVYAGMRNVRFRNRFGGTVVLSRRCYKYRQGGGGWNPLDEKLGLDRCLGYSPLMSYLLSSFGGSEPFGRGSELLSEALGFAVSPTAVQRNTEAVGKRISDNPYQMIAAEKAQQTCECMVVQVDGTISPQILEKQGLSGRESLKQPTDWKECNVVVIQKLTGGEQVDRWTGARYGKHVEFEIYAGRAALAMGQHVAKKVVFLADGAHTNWELQKTNFPGSVGILDFYHASEHLGSFTALLKDQRKASAAHHRWAQMLLRGQALQVIEELRHQADRVADRDAAIREINYFKNNLSRMDYDSFEEQGFPIGSGLVEGSCKLVVGKRFKGNGMRWKKQDNTRVLRVRVEKLNGTLQKYFKPEPQKWITAACAA